MNAFFRSAIAGLLLSVLPVSGIILPADDFVIGEPGEPLLGSELASGGQFWKNARESGGVLSGTFRFAGAGGVVPGGSETGANIYTDLKVSEIPEDYRINLVFRANDSAADSARVTLALVETVDLGHLTNIRNGDVVLMSYETGGASPGTFRLRVNGDGVELANRVSNRRGNEPLVPGDLVEISFTVHTRYGLVRARAYNLTRDYLISALTVSTLSPDLRHMRYAGFGVNGLSGNNPANPVRIESFEVFGGEDIHQDPPIVLPDTYPVSMTFSSFAGVSSDELQKSIDAHAPIEIIHGIRPTLMLELEETYPEKILLHQDAFGGIGMFPEDKENVYPGHLLLRPGTIVTADIQSTDTVIAVGEPTRLAARQAEINRVNNNYIFYLLLYALDEEGNPDWNRAENVILDAIDMTAGTVTVRRGQLGSTPLNLEAGKAVLARHMMFWTRQWQLNFSLDCPRGGPLNLTAAEWYAMRKTERLDELGGSGIEFDVGRWMWGNPSLLPMDSTNDLIADYGYVDGVNRFGLGAQVFFRELRHLLGPSRIIQVDGNDSVFGQRGWKYINGVQIESFPSANKFERFSQTFIHLQQWVESVETEPSFSYAFTKTPTTLFGHVVGLDGSNLDWRFRIGFASALLTGTPHPFNSMVDINFDPENPENNEDVNLTTERGLFPWEEYYAGHRNDWKWLGKPLGPAVQVLDQVQPTDLLEGQQWEIHYESGFTGAYDFEEGIHKVEVHALPNGMIPWVPDTFPGSMVPRALWYGMRLRPAHGDFPELQPGQEYTLVFEARGNNTWEVGDEILEKVPRMLAVHGIADYPQLERLPVAVALDPNWRTYRLTLKAPDDVPRPLEFGVSEQIGWADIRNIQLHEGGSDLWMREFEGGMVLLNMNWTPWQVQLDGLFRSIFGTQNLSINDGQPVPKTVKVPVWDALFLVRRSETNDELYRDWAMDKGLPDGEAGFADDPNQNGFSNLFEYAMKSSPSDPDRSISFGFSSEEHGATGETLLHVFPLRQDAGARGLELRVLRSNDLRSWTDATGLLTDGLPVGELVPVKYPLDPKDNKPEFLKYMLILD